MADKKKEENKGMQQYNKQNNFWFKHGFNGSSVLLKDAMVGSDTVYRLKNMAETIQIDEVNVHAEYILIQAPYCTAMKIVLYSKQLEVEVGEDDYQNMRKYIDNLKKKLKQGSFVDYLKLYEVTD